MEGERKTMDEREKREGKVRINSDVSISHAQYCSIGITETVNYPWML